jgi:DNA repair exonuclease SbcCD ATPase subunit
MPTNTNTKELQITDLLKNADIRTMKKDLKQLREADATSEKKKIFAGVPSESGPIKTPVSPPAPTYTPPAPVEEVISPVTPKVSAAPIKEVASIEPAPPVIDKTPEIKVQSNNVQQRANVLSQHERQEHEITGTLKPYANAQEKQEIFLLESQKAELETQIQSLAKDKTPSVVLEKNKTLISQRSLQEKLDVIIQEEGKIEDGITAIETKEKEATVPQERQGLEKRRWALESQREGIEKKRWVIENEMVKSQDSLKDFDQNSKIFNDQASKLTANVTEIDERLRAIYAGISTRENNRRSSLERENAVVIAQKESEAAASKKIKEQEWVQSLENNGKDYAAEIPLSVKEKLAKTTAVEEENRKKFMEDVENWAKEHTNNTTQDE